MNIIIPMAGMGKRLRPHTLVVPKPLLSVAGKPIVHHLVEDLAGMCDGQIDNIYFVVGHFGKEAEDQLVKTAESLGAKGHIRYQDQPLGTAHAVDCAKEGLSGPVIIAFADTLFRANFTLDPSADGVLYVKHIDNPEQFGVVKMDTEGYITDFVEKPKVPVSNLAMIGIYYFKNGEELRKEIEWLIENDQRKGGEYQLPDAFTRLVEKGKKMLPGEVSEWMDCGNYAVTVETNSRLLYHLEKEGRLPTNTFERTNSVVIQPCCIGLGVVLRNAVIGPNVTLGAGTIVESSVVADSLIGNSARITNATIKHSLLGSHTAYTGHQPRLSLGDFSTQE